MKNQRIVKAYDSINPTAAEKERMLRAILAEAPPAPEPKKKKEPIVYTARPTKTSRGSIIAGIAACVAVVIVAGFVFGFMMNRDSVNPAYVEPTTEATEPITEAPEFPDSPYTEVLELYRRARDQGWNSTMCVENGISMRTPIESEYEGLYYAVSDLDGNGVEELIISEFPCREDMDTDFLEIYTVRNGRANRIMTNGDMEMRYLCEGGVVKDLTPPERGDYDVYISFWEIQQDRIFAQTGHIYNIDGQWYHGFRANEKITAEEAEAEVKSYQPAKLDFIEISAPEETESLTGYEGYDDIINKYVTALSENWTTDQCQQNDISPNIFFDTTVSHNLGWCLLDIDENGVEELIISDGVHLFDLYVMQPHNGGPGHLISAYPNSYQLCENGIIQCQEYFSGTTMWRWLQLSDIDYVQRDIVFYDGQLNQYYYGTDGEKLKPISKDEAGNLISRDRTAELTLTPFVKAEPFAPEEMEYYEPLLDIYRQAIREDWGPGDCVENGISLMVGNYGDFVMELGYATMDLDSNGIQELIITDGTNIYDLYTIIQDEETGPLRLIDAMERIEYFLVQNNRIYCRGSGGAARMYHTLYDLDGRELVVLEGYAFDADTDPDDPWFYYDGENIGDPCGSFDAQAVVDKLTWLGIPFTPFVETPVGEEPIN